MKLHRMRHKNDYEQQTERDVEGSCCNGYHGSIGQTDTYLQKNKANTDTKLVSIKVVLLARQPINILARSLSSDANF